VTDTALSLLRERLGFTTGVRDNLLQTLLKAELDELKRIHGLSLNLEETSELMLLVDVAAWRYQRSPDPMPHNLRYKIKQYLISAAGRGDLPGVDRDLDPGKIEAMVARMIEQHDKSSAAHPVIQAAIAAIEGSRVYRQAFEVDDWEPYLDRYKLFIGADAHGRGLVAHVQSVTRGDGAYSTGDIVTGQRIYNTGDIEIYAGEPFDGEIKI
jgi:hypothetical protein